MPSISLALLVMTLVWLFQDNLVETCTLRSFSVVTDVICEPLSVKFESTTFFFLVIARYLHFFELNSMKWSADQSFRFDSSLCNCWTSLVLSMILKHFISSTYSCTVVLECIALGAVFIKIINKSGPKLDPWGTPDDIGNNDDSQPSMTVLWRLHVKYGLNQESSLRLILTSSSSFNKQLKETESNTLL